MDNVRVAKLLGGGLHDSTVVEGIVLKNDAVGTIKRIEKAKVSLGSCIRVYAYPFMCLMPIPVLKVV